MTLTLLKIKNKMGKKCSKKIKMISQKNENLLDVQQWCSVYFCEKIDSKSGFFQQISMALSMSNLNDFYEVKSGHDLMQL